MGKRISNRKSLLLSPCCESPDSNSPLPRVACSFSRKAFRTVCAGYGTTPALFHYTIIDISKMANGSLAEGNNGENGGEETFFIGNVSSQSPISSRRFLRVPHAERFSPAHRELSFTAAVAACLYAATTGNPGAVCRCAHQARRRCRRFHSCCDGPSPNGTAAACTYGSGCRS